MRHELSLHALAQATISAAIAIAVASWLTMGCTRLLGPGATVTDVKDIITQANMRGCIYVRGSTLFSDAGTMMLIGTWGQNPPEYRECFTGLPVSPP